MGERGCFISGGGLDDQAVACAAVLRSDYYRSSPSESNALSVHGSVLGHFGMRSDEPSERRVDVPGASAAPIGMSMTVAGTPNLRSILPMHAPGAPTTVLDAPRVLPGGPEALDGSRSRRFEGLRDGKPRVVRFAGCWNAYG